MGKDEIKMSSMNEFYTKRSLLFAFTVKLLSVPFSRRFVTVPFFVAVIRDVNPLPFDNNGLYGMLSLAFLFGIYDGKSVCFDRCLA